MYLKSLEQGEMLASQWEDADVEAGGAAAAAAAQEEAKEKEVTRPLARPLAHPPAARSSLTPSAALFTTAPPLSRTQQHPFTRFPVLTPAFPV